MSITCGVPQGSVLGPLLFLIYINDLVNSANKLSTILFADDTNLFYSGKDIGTIEYTVNNELTQIQEWLTSNQLTLNVKKTNFIIFKSQVNRQINIKLNKEILQRVEKTKFLGLIIDQHLKSLNFQAFFVGFASSSVNRS